MSIQFGSEKRVDEYDDGSRTISAEKIYKGEVTKVYRQFRVVVTVTNAQEEMTEYLRFTKDLHSKRTAGILTTDKIDATTQPAFTLAFPRNNVDGSYQIIKSWCEVSI